MTCDIFLPQISLIKRMNTGIPTWDAAGDNPMLWSVWAEMETDYEARCQVKVLDTIVADISVHSPDRDNLPYRITDVCQSILWSKLLEAKQNEDKKNVWKVLEDFVNIAIYQPLWPGDVVSKAYLKRLEAAGLVKRTDSGHIILSGKGKQLWVRLKEI